MSLKREDYTDRLRELDSDRERGSENQKILRKSFKYGHFRNLREELYYLFDVIKGACCWCLFYYRGPIKRSMVIKEEEARVGH